MSILVIPPGTARHVEIDRANGEFSPMHFIDCCMKLAVWPAWDRIDAARASHLVIEAKLAFRHACQEGAHFEGTQHLRPHNCAIAVDQQIDAFNHVQKDFILFVLDALTPPGDCISDCHGRPCLHLQFLGILRLKQRASCETECRPLQGLMTCACQ